MNNPRDFLINNQGLAKTPLGKVMYSEPRRGARIERIPVHEEDTSAELLEFDITAFALLSKSSSRDTINLEIISEMIDKLRVKTLVMTEFQYTRKYHEYFRNIPSRSKKPESNTDTEDLLVRHREIRKQEALEIILQYQKAQMQKKKYK
ncbi:hypothetical protein PtA15_3A680 [Puccinia triticina]|uniref:Uncharacterized protein n=1 Tax=Puccinia triticina TaxID=208348 RepID=A0ABY7CDK0_9BASI|nr:uncharacterized protein PtA15_3A680 [Puccinia triticina]WAQ83311.1 hypothetical protein PtA15_3A680 [Puccinia triticina]